MLDFGQERSTEGLLRVSSFMFLVSSYFSVTTPKAAEPSAKAFGRSIVLCTFKVLSIAYGGYFTNYIQNSTKKDAMGCIHTLFLVSSF